MGELIKSAAISVAFAVLFIGVLASASYLYAWPEGKLSGGLKRLLTLLASIALAFLAVKASVWGFLRFGVGTMTAGGSYVRQEIQYAGFYDIMDAVQDISGEWHLNHTQDPALVVRFSVPQSELDKLEWLEWDKSRPYWHNSEFWDSFSEKYGFADVERRDHYHSTDCRVKGGLKTRHQSISRTFTYPDETGMTDVFCILEVIRNG